MDFPEAEGPTRMDRTTSTDTELCSLIESSYSKQEVSGYELNGSNKLRQYFDTNNASWDRANGRTAWGCLGSLKLCNT